MTSKDRIVEAVQQVCIELTQPGILQNDAVRMCSAVRLLVSDAMLLLFFLLLCCRNCGIYW